MNLNENLLRSFAKAVNATNEKETKLYYGTITKVEEVDGVRVPYVHLDGSDPNSETPLVEGTEVMVADRVIVTIENHKAVVMSNITSPASARTASSYMDLFPEGLVIGEIDGDPSDIDFNVLIRSDGMYIRYGVESDDPNDPVPVILARYTVNGVVLGQNNEIVIQASPIQETVERFNTTSFTLSKDVSNVISVIGETCIETVTEGGVTTQVVVNDVTIPSSDYTLSGQNMVVNSPLTGTTIEPQSIVVTYTFTGKLMGTISIGANSVISEHLPLVIGNNNLSKAASNIFSVDWSGKVSAAGGCNAKIIFKDVTVNNLAVSSNGTTSGTAHVTVPSGYTPCALVAYRVRGHPCYFIRVDLNTNGDIEYAIHNPSGTNWTGVSVFFQISCIRTV